MPSASRPRSPLWLVVLSLVSEAPMHPYRMQALIKERGKDQIANVAQRNSVYQTIAALRRAGLIAVRETSREERRPERSVYEVTRDGRRMLKVWMRTVLSVPAREFPDFPAALSLVAGAEPGEVRVLLEARTAVLEARLAELEQPVPGLPRVFLLENEYMAAVVRAEVAWLLAVIDDLRAGRLTWSAEGLRRLVAEWAAQGTAPPGAVANLETNVAEKPRAAKKARRRRARKPRRT